MEKQTGIEAENKVPVITEASGTVKEQKATSDNSELEGLKVETEQGKVEFKKVVTGHFLGAPIEKVVPVRESNENTTTVGDDVQLFNDWDDRAYLIDCIEGIHSTDPDGRPVRVVPGLMDIANDYAFGRISDMDLPEHSQFRQWLLEYKTKQIQAARYRVPMDIDIKVGARFFFEASLDGIKERREKLVSEHTLGVVSAQEYGNTRMLLDLAEAAYKRYLKGDIKL